MRLKTVLMAAGILLFLAALVQLLTIRQTLRERTAAGGGPVNVLTLTNAVMNQSEGNTLRIMVWADAAVYSEDRARALLTNVRFTAYPKPEDGKAQEPVQGTSAQAEVRSRDARLELIGRVRIHRGERTEMRGERIVYHYRDGLVTSRDPVWIRNDRTIQEGQTLRYSVPEESARLTKPLLWE
jgi:LPS export ABC transporter protein LptC